VIRVSQEAKRLLGSIWTPDGEVLRVDRSVRRGVFDGSSVEVVDGTLGVVPPGPGPQTSPLFPFTGRQ
jgi:hypothetical protein